MENFNKKKGILTLLLLLGIVVFLIVIGIVNLFHFTYGLNADISSDTLLGSLIWDSKEILPSTWYVARETRIICTPNVAALFYGLTHNMMLSTGLACTTMTILILCSFFYFGKSLNFSIRENLLFAFLCLIIPSTFIILELLYLFASYYAVHVVIFFLTLGMYIRAVRGEMKWSRLVVGGGLLALVLGIQGARGILVIYAPLFGMEILRGLYRLYCKEEWKKTDCFVGLWVVGLLIISFIGMTFPISVGQELSRNIRNGFTKLFTIVIPNVGAAMGFGSNHTADKICMVVFLLVTAYLLIDIFYRMFRKKEIEMLEWGFLVICASLAVSVIMVSFTTVDTTERYYFQYIFVMACSIVLLFRKLKQYAKLRAGAYVCTCLVIVVIVIERFSFRYFPILKEEEPIKNDIYQVVTYLEEKELYTAYSTFYFANTITILSNGEIRAAAVDSVSNMGICRWMTSTDWYVPNVPFEAKTAYVIPESVMGDFDEFLAMHGDDMQFEAQIGSYFIYSSEYNFSRMDIY